MQAESLDTVSKTGYVFSVISFVGNSEFVVYEFALDSGHLFGRMVYWVSFKAVATYF